MNMMQVSVIGMLGTMFAILLKNYKPEYSVIIMIGTCCILFAYALSYLEAITSVLEKYSDELNNDGYVTIILKVVGMTYVSEFSASICRDAGYSAIASQVELFGKVVILFAGTPIIIALFEMISNL